MNHPDRPDTSQGDLAQPKTLTPALPAVASFADLELPAEVLRTLTELGVREPFPIQAATLPNALAGRDLLGRGRTGSGKTLAFGLPLLVRTAGRRAEPKQPLALILVPTRELAQQVTEALAPYADALRLRMATVVGGMSIGRQVAALRDGAEIVVATPGRLHDLIERKACRLGRVRITVLDEADQMCDMGFLPQVTEVLDQVHPDGQRMLFSATLDRDVDHLVRSYLHDPVVHSVDPSAGAVTTMDHHVLIVHGPDRYAVTTEIAARDGRVLLFLDTKHAVDQLTRHLRASGVHAAALHSGKAQPQRTRTLAQFKNGQITVLVATNVAARGLHIDDLDLVVNVDPPTDPKDYVHRAGRTARAGESGRVVTLVLSGQRREMSRLMSEAGIEPTVTKVRSGEAELSRITGARTPSGAPLDGPAAPRPKNTNAPFRGLGTSKDTSRGTGGTGGKSRKSGEARKLAEARKAAMVRRGR
ncbi:MULTISPECIES: DEAD/DEAH box helicase [unclassified Streptomyces]|uniref:DEAD/DEAH box helicase n=1 Tax=unclassified Streptomyces TaxID=2593676 RepID=UPI002E7FECFD|nr:DEAD/DEAH box helicase [Streptomyces sp. NBC_00589]WTI34781.1 DEAD/DEAH box helicase [Streptomyces sp. NBC_00775]WUB31545.1 DEAD/DEAH box helicase [Streptomyces sp. NBC_00589]